MKGGRSPRESSAGNTGLRRLPAVEILLESADLAAEIIRYSRPLVTQAIQQTMASLRDEIRQGSTPPPQSGIIEMVKSRLTVEWPAFMTPIINATGVVLHTNLGRAPMAPAALEALSVLGSCYMNLESDLSGGQRGQRIVELRKLLCILSGAEDALAVNNNAAAVLLILVALANGKEAIVSRGELVQIGGGFRVPEIMKQSGVTLKEVGTTNQTFARDYDVTVNDKTAMLLKVHPSNFEQSGFVHEASINELATIARKHNIPLVYDLGSGALLDTVDFGLGHEPTVQEALAAGADVICFSGDKLIGGPQAGIILGKKQFMASLLKHPLLRVIRLDKLSAIALEATLKCYLDKRATDSIPIWQMMSQSVEELQKRAAKLASNLRHAGIKVAIRDGRSMVGGGSLPEQSLPTRLLAIKPLSGVDDVSRRLRLGNPPLVARIEQGELLFDLRTVFPEQDKIIPSIIRQAWVEKG
jgi:L-seryl-tRNA(Ser) seleniumtransferase